MAERPTAGYQLEFDTDGVVGILQEFDVVYEGDSEDISGTGDTQGSIVRRNSAPIDVGSTITMSGKIDDTAAGFANFEAAMENRTADSVIRLLKDSEGWQYTGHSESYTKSMSRSEAIWNFSLTFVVNSENAVSSS